MNLNKVLLIGRLTADPELRTTASGTHVVTFSLATNRTWTDKDGKKQESTEFHNIVFWGKQASIISQFSTKGSLLHVEGRLQTRSWEGKDGQTRRTTEVIGENFQFGPKPAGSSGGNFRQASDNTEINQEKNNSEMPVINLDEGDIKPEDLPF